VENERNQRRFESVYSKKVRAGKRRTYFFDVRKTKGDDYYLTLTESTRRFDGDGYERHKIFLYKEDFNRFQTSLTDTLDYIKTELMPDYDYDEYTRRHEEWEAKRAEEERLGITRDNREEKTATAENTPTPLANEIKKEEEEEEEEEKITEEVETTETDDEEDMSW